MRVTMAGRRARTWTCVLLAGAGFLLQPGPVADVAAAATSSAVPNPAVTGPVAASSGLRGRPKNQTVVPVSPAGFIEQEFLLAGSARDLSGSGASPAPYRTRMLVRRPLDARRFNGTVLVEWFNVTGQEDSELQWSNLYQLAMREGYAYAAVSAQRVGVDNLRGWDPVRYGSLSHPGDAYSFDVFAQAVQALRRPQGIAPLGGLRVQRALAVGLSQSGMRLHSYLDNGAQNATRVVDAFLILGDGNAVFDVAKLRTPVVQYMSEAEVGEGVLARDGAPSRSPYLRLWQVAGTAHANTWAYDYYRARMSNDHTGTGTFDAERSGDYGQEGGIHLPLRSAPPPPPAVLEAGCANSTETPDRYVISSAVVQLNRWVRGRGPAIQPPLIEVEDGAIVRDAYGNAKGGLRLPQLDVPVATYNGAACTLIGSTVGFDAATLARLYPTAGVYVARMQRATNAAVAKRYILPADAQDLMARVRKAEVPLP